MKFNGPHLSKNYILSPKTLFTDLSNITFNYLCENSPNSLCHFWNHKTFFMTQLVNIILAQTLHTLDKNISSKCKFLDFSLLKLKFIKFLMSFFKKNRGVISHDSEDWCKIWRQTDLFFQKMTRIWWNLTWALASLQSLHFDLLLLCKVFNVWAKKVQRSYLSWHRGVMQDLKKNWLLVWKMTWRIWQIFTRALESLKIAILMGSFNPK